MATTSYAIPNYPTPDEIRDGILSAIRYSYARDSIAVNVLPGSDHWRRAKVYADRLSILVSNNKLSVAALSPLTAQGQDLIDLASVFGVEKRPASGAAGNVYCLGFAGSVVPIPAGFTLTMPNGTQFETVAAQLVTLTGQTVTSSTPRIAVRARKGGSATNIKANTVGQWDSAALALLSPKCIVDESGLTGGADEDNQETLRDRLLRKLRAPAIGGNWAHVKQLAENSTAAVEMAFVYPSVRGPGAYDVAVTQAGASRALPSVHVATARAAIRGEMPGVMSHNVTRCDDEPIDVVLDMRLPLPASAGGAGGGWIDATPWPSNADSVLCQIIARDVGGDSKKITVNSTSADKPVAGNTIALWSSAAGEFIQYAIVSFAGSSGAYTLELAEAVAADVAVGHYVSASCELLASYAADFVAQVRTLGPGEKSTDPRVMPRGLRQPTQDVENPSSLTEIHTSAVIAAHREILGLSYAGRFAAGTATPKTTASVATLTKDPPKILTLANLAIRRAV